MPGLDFRAGRVRHGVSAGLLAELRGGLVGQITPDDAVTRALRGARAAGWVPFVVTNGTVQQQERKLCTPDWTGR
jgi:hypothetical protein